MAVGTGLAQLASVSVVFAMAIHTGRRGRAEFFAIFMARGARSGRMVAAERKIRQLMIKGDAIKLYNVGLATFVVGMTLTAFAVGDSCRLAVKA